MIAFSQRRPPTGFTLLELMLVVGIISIMTAMAIGFTTDWRRRSQFDTVAREIYNGLNLARAKAIRRGSQVDLAFLDTAGQKALYVFVDNSSPKNHEFDVGSDSLLYTFPSDPDDWPTGVSAINATLDTGTDVANGGLAVLIFDAYGFHIDVNHNPRGATITVKDMLSGAEHYVDVTVAGALRVR